MAVGKEVLATLVIALLCAGARADGELQGVGIGELTPSKVFPVSGAVKLSAIPDVPAREVDIVLSVHGAERRRAAVKPDGSFVINEVPTGSHLMEVVAVGYVFPAYRLDVDEDGRKTMAYADDPSIKIDIPFVLEPLMKANYDQEGQFSLAMILRNPMYLLIAASLVMMLVLPKMIENMDPNELEQMRNQPNLADVLSGKMSWQELQQQMEAQSRGQQQQASQSRR